MARKKSPASMPDTIAIRIRAARLEASLTQVEASAAAGITQSHLSALEVGKAEPSIPVLYKLAEALGVHARDLLPD